MYKLKPPQVYVMERVLKNEQAAARMNRMMKMIDAPEPTVVKDEDTDELARSLGLYDRKRTGEKNQIADPVMVFNTYQFPSEDANDEERDVARQASQFRGGGWWKFRDKAKVAEQGKVCQSAYEIHSIFGCVHKCDYCSLTNIVNMMLNLEEFVAELDGLVKRTPWQTLYKYDNQSDTICFEPEYGASELLVDYFSQQEKACLMLYTKSANVEHLLDLKHNGHTIVCWTLSSDTASKVIERDTGTMRERIEAARLCQEAGYTVRFRCSPILPIKGWQEETEEMFDALFADVRPDVIVIETLYVLDAAEFRRTFDANMFDPKFVNNLEEDPNVRLPDKPFPFDLRCEVYRFFIDAIRKRSPGTRIALCLETPEIWAKFGPEIGMQPERYLCCCGPLCTPGTALYRQFASCY